MNEVSLTSFLKKCPSLTKIVFPNEERFMEAEEVIDCIIYEGKDDSCEANVTADFFIRYIREINQRQGGESIIYTVPIQLILSRISLKVSFAYFLMQNKFELFIDRGGGGGEWGGGSQKASPKGDYCH